MTTQGLVGNVTQKKVVWRLTIIHGKKNGKEDTTYNHTGRTYPPPPCKDPKPNEIGDTVLIFLMGKPNHRLQSSPSPSHTKRQQTR